MKLVIFLELFYWWYHEHIMTDIVLMDARMTDLDWETSRDSSSEDQDWCNPNFQGYWIEGSKKFRPEM